MYYIAGELCQWQGMGALINRVENGSGETRNLKITYNHFL